ncbi:bifunctional metallophosphatase/5'-nucleotidase [Bifidobacterium callimiconis]|uniref:5'-nucleotidase n=1 Tax=Bifidobacterium callimiconis TaxID=2306973 RepID=A0A430FD54_9BIFI|nr:5'-nucleotidase C-terminal domain-containing protein [Bifidobacterium callimiconis]RSX50757.1 5'-nucleotidase [Bifidobacterium callimiconis]
MAVLLTGTIVSRPASAVEDERTVTIADITDFHGHIEHGEWVESELEQARRHNPGNTVFVSAGDLVGGSPYPSAVQRDRPTLDMAGVWGLTVSAMGNHELDRGVDDFNDRIAAPGNGIDWLAANVTRTKRFSNLHDYAIRTINGTRVAFVGAVTDRLSSVLSASVMKDVQLNDTAVRSINRVADRLSDGDESNGEADVVVALIHDDADTIAKDGTGLDGNVDLVYAGHTHANKTGRHTRSGAPIIEAGSYGNAVAVQDLLVSGSGCDSHVTVRNAFDAPLQKRADTAMRTASAKSDSTIDRRAGDIVRAANAFAHANGDVPVAKVDQPYDKTGERGRDALNTIVADAALDGARRIRGSADARIGFSNPGSLRTRALDLNGDGTITVREARDMMALQFDNATIVLDGAHVKHLIARQWKRGRDGVWHRTALGVSSNVSADVSFSGHTATVRELRIDGKPVDDDQMILVAGNSFLLTGGDGFLDFLSGSDYRDTGVSYAQTLIDFLRSGGADRSRTGNT